MNGGVGEQWFQLDAVTLFEQLGLRIVPGPRLLARLLARPQHRPARCAARVSVVVASCRIIDAEQSQAHGHVGSASARTLCMLDRLCGVSAIAIRQ